MNWERWARAAGIGFVLFTVAAFIVGGEPPKVSDSAQDVAAYFTDDRHVGALPIAAFVLVVSVGEANPDDSAMAQLGRSRCRGAPGSPQHHVGERRILVTDRRVSVHRGSSGAALDPDHKHRVGSQRPCPNDDAASGISAGDGMTAAGKIGRSGSVRQSRKRPLLDPAGSSESRDAESSGPTHD